MIAIGLVLLCGILFFSKAEEKKSPPSAEEMRGIFISYIELQKYLQAKSEMEMKQNIQKMIYNVKSIKANTIILHTRMMSDAIYESRLFPFSAYISGEEGKKTLDVLSYFLEEAHRNKVKVMAWINPYRIRGTEDLSTITQYSPAYPYIGTDTIYVHNGIYWNPSKKVVEDLIVEGVKEVLEYPIDGVLMDDYFYPSSDIDLQDYQEYQEKNPISLEDYHFMIVNRLVKRIHEECQKKKIDFGISPDGNIENNYQKHFADIYLWTSNKDYIDFIMPQIYYGFYNSTKAYYKVSKEWSNIIQTPDIKLYIALAFYKVGQEDSYAKEGKLEWITNNDIIMREVLLSRNLRQYHGFSLYRYDSVFAPPEGSNNAIEELENLKKIVK